MKKLVASVLVASMAFSAGTALAGGPVIDDTVEVVPEKPRSSVGILPIILIGVVLCAALCGGNDNRPNG